MVQVEISVQKDFVSANDITFEGIDKIVNLLEKRKQKGITLIALVITIIILLILAGISISALTNQ